MQLNKLSSIMRELGYKKVALAPFALSFILTLLLINKFRTVRIHEVINSRFGHFATNTELSFLNSLERDTKLKIKSINFYCLGHHTSTNLFFESLIKRQLVVVPGAFGWLVIFLARKLSLKNLLQTTTNNDKKGLLTKYPPSFNFSDEEIRLGEKFLKSLGILDGQRFVCLNVRDDSFLAESQPLGWSQSRDWSYHSYRDSNIEDYVPAAEKLGDMGYTVFRMGAIVKKPFYSTHPKIIDYATNGMRTEFLDLFLGAYCAFCIATGTGWDSVPQIYRRPSLYVNLIPLASVDCLVRDLLIFPKVLLDTNTRRELTLKDIDDRGGLQFSLTKQYDEAGISIRDMNPKELVQAVTEMAARVEGKFIPTEQQKSIQEKLRHELMNNPKVQPSPGFYPIRAEFAACFLSNYPNFLD